MQQPSHAETFRMIRNTYDVTLHDLADNTQKRQKELQHTDSTWLSTCRSSAMDLCPAVWRCGCWCTARRVGRLQYELTDVSWWPAYRRMSAMCRSSSMTCSSNGDNLSSICRPHMQNPWRRYRPESNRREQRSAKRAAKENVRRFVDAVHRRLTPAMPQWQKGKTLMHQDTVHSAYRRKQSLSHSNTTTAIITGLPPGLF